MLELSPVGLTGSKIVGPILPEFIPAFTGPLRPKW
jgi:hypothetical protein